MKKIITITAILISLTIIFGSCASKKYTRKAAKLEAAGQYEESADLYYLAVMKKKTNVEAHSGLKRTGQITLSKKLTEFNKAYNNQENKAAVNHYQDARTYYDKLAAVEVDLNFPAFYDEYYEEVKNIYLEDKYYEGTKLLDEERFAAAEIIFREIVRLQKNYKDSQDKLIIATYEPLYRSALDLMEKNKFRQAYYKFDDIIKGAGTYQSSYDLKAECLTKGTITVTISEIDNKTSTSGIESTLESKIISNIQSYENPFIKLIDSNSQNRAVRSSGTTTSKQITPSLTLYCTISKFTYNKGSQQKTEKRGYLRKKVKVMNRETEEYETKTEYDKVVYYEYKMSRTLDMSYTYKLVNTRSSEILTTSSKSILTRDDIYYATYSGDKKNLVPGYWKHKNTSSSEDQINDNKNALNKLNNLLDARAQIKDYNTLSTEALNNSADKISTVVNDYVNEN